jgi:hypothetical protein
MVAQRPALPIARGVGQCSRALASAHLIPIPGDDTRLGEVMALELALQLEPT